MERTGCSLGAAVGSERAGTAEPEARRRLTGSRKGQESGKVKRSPDKSGGEGDSLPVFSMSGLRVLSYHSLMM